MRRRGTGQSGGHSGASRGVVQAPRKPRVGSEAHLSRGEQGKSREGLLAQPACGGGHGLLLALSDGQFRSQRRTEGGPWPHTPRLLLSRGLRRRSRAGQEGAELGKGAQLAGAAGQG